MKTNANIFFPQEQFDWHGWRRAGLGGSDSYIIMNAAPAKWGTRQTLWELKTGKRLPDPATWPMKRGIEMEPYARKWYETQTGLLIPKALAVHREHEFARISLDGYSQADIWPVELKHPGKADHFIARAGRIPDKYVWQCVQYLLVLNLEAMDYCSYNPKYFYECGGRDGLIVPFRRDKFLEERLLAALFEFWECVVKDIPPPSAPPCLRGKAKLTVLTTKPSLFKTRRSLGDTSRSSTKAQGLPIDLDAIKKDMDDLGKLQRIRQNERERKQRIKEGRRSIGTLGKVLPMTGVQMAEKKVTGLTGKEIVDIMEKAKELGARTIKVGDIEVDFSGAEPVYRRDDDRPNTPAVGSCRCGAPLPIGRNGKPFALCNDCFYGHQGPGRGNGQWRGR